jgi:DegV family protein with EDD domain
MMEDLIVMGKFCVATDSGCDLPAGFCRDRSIFAYPMHYSIGETEYADELLPALGKAFYDKMREGAVPLTSQMTPFEFIGFWSELLAQHHLPIVHVAMGSGISGTCANALIARDLFLEDHPNAQVYVCDSTLASIGYGMLCVFAANARDAGKTPEACLEELERRKAFINTYYTTNDLKYLHRSGRVSTAGVIVATALNINPILNLDLDGHLIVREKIRGRKNALERIYRLVQEARGRSAPNQTVYICHSDCCEDEVQAFRTI